MSTFTRYAGVLLLWATGFATPAQDISVIGGRGNLFSHQQTIISEYIGTSFGFCSVTSGTVERSYTIANLDLDTPLRVDLVELTGSTDFSVTQSPETEFDKSSSFTIRFDPTSPGIKVSMVIIHNNDPDGSQGLYTFPIQGEGVQQPPEFMDINVEVPFGFKGSYRNRKGAILHKVKGEVWVSNNGPKASGPGLMEIYYSSDALFNNGTPDGLATTLPMPSMPVSSDTFQRFRITTYTDASIPDGHLIFRWAPNPSPTTDSNYINNQSIGDIYDKR